MAQRERATWREAVPAGVRLTVVPPPYHAARLWSAGMAPGRGDVLLFDLDEPAPDSFPALADVVRQLRGGLPVATAVRVQLQWPYATRLITDARALGFDAVVLDGEPLAAGLTAFLAQPFDLAGDWVRWLGGKGVPARLREIVREVVARSPESGSVHALCAHLPIPARTLRDTLRQHALPKLERWYDGARLLQADLELQRDPSLSIEDVAQWLGYADAYSYSSRAYRLFGITPAASRKLLGLQWRFDAWWRRSRRLSVHSGNNPPSALLLSSHD